MALTLLDYLKINQSAETPLIPQKKREEYNNPLLNSCNM